MGAMVAFMAFSRDAELASRVRLLVAISPIARVSNLRGILAVGAMCYKPLLVCCAQIRWRSSESDSVI